MSLKKVSKNYFLISRYQRKMYHCIFNLILTLNIVIETHETNKKNNTFVCKANYQLNCHALKLRISMKMNLTFLNLIPFEIVLNLEWITV